MIGLKYQTLKPVIEPHIRLLASHSDSRFGIQDNEEHIAMRLNAILEALETEEPYQHYRRMINVPYPDLDREKTEGMPVFTDITLKETGRQNKGMEERFRKGLMNVQDVRLMTDSATRLHYPSSRGLERRMIRLINDLDAEAMNRTSLRPISIN